MIITGKTCGSHTVRHYRKTRVKVTSGGNRSTCPTPRCTRGDRTSAHAAHMRAHNTGGFPSRASMPQVAIWPSCSRQFRPAFFMGSIFYFPEDRLQQVMSCHLRPVCSGNLLQTSGLRNIRRSFSAQMSPVVTRQRAVPDTRWGSPLDCVQIKPRPGKYVGLVADYPGPLRIQVKAQFGDRGDLDRCLWINSWPMSQRNGKGDNTAPLTASSCDQRTRSYLRTLIGAERMLAGPTIAVA